MKAVIFDMDGVLVDSHPIHRRAWRQLLLDLGVEPTEKALEFVTEGAKQQEILRYFLGDLTDEQVQLYGRRKNELFREGVQDLKTLKGLLPFLDTLERAAVRRAIATSAAKSRTDWILELFQLRERFEVIVTGDDVPNGKANPQIFCRAAELLALPNQNLLVIEDSVPGVRAAKAVGMKCLGIAAEGRAAALLHSGADLVASDFTHVAIDQLMHLFDSLPLPVRR